MAIIIAIYLPHLKKKPDPANGWDISGFSIIAVCRHDRNWQSILHSHAFAELFYVIHGTGCFSDRK